MLDVLALLWAVLVLCVAAGFLVFGLLWLLARSVFDQFNAWWLRRFMVRGIRVPGYYTALALGLCVVPLVTAVVFRQWQWVLYLAPATLVVAVWLSARGWGQRGPAQPGFPRFAKIFYEPAYYFGGLVGLAGKVAEWGLLLGPQKIALLLQPPL